MAFKLPFKRVPCNDLLDLRYCPNHHRDIESEVFLDRIVYLCREFCVACFRCVECDVAAVDVALYILKSQRLECSPQRLHLDHVLSRDVYAAEQGHVSHAFFMSMTKRYRTSDLTVRSYAVSM